MRRILVLLAAFGVLAASFATAQANEVPEHGHLLVTGISFDDDGEPVGFKHCRLLAAGRAVPLNAHHDHIHTGRAGEALWNAGNAVVPLAPLTLWSTCAEFEAIVFG